MLDPKKQFIAFWRELPNMVVRLGNPVARSMREGEEALHPSPWSSSIGQVNLVSREFE
jgi:hypothetical protein